MIICCGRWRSLGMRVISRPCRNIKILCTGFQCIYSHNTAHRHRRASKLWSESFLAHAPQSSDSNSLPPKQLAVRKYSCRSGGRYIMFSIFLLHLTLLIVVAKARKTGQSLALPGKCGGKAVKRLCFIPCREYPQQQECTFTRELA